MDIPASVVIWSQQNTETWRVATLDKLNKDEKFLEDLLATRPELLGLDGIRTGIQTPFKAFQQIGLVTPTKRGIIPDIILFAASGHVILVEVKRYINPELRRRDVIAQLIDYASSVRDLKEDELLRRFAPSDSALATWADLVATWFPDHGEVESLANEYIRRMASGEVNLVVACDRAPPGLAETIASIASQATLGFELDLVEVTPYVLGAGSAAQILFIPGRRLATEIVARTVVNITYRPGDPPPVAEVQTMSLEEIEENIKQVKQATSGATKEWTLEDVDREFQQAGNRTALELLQFCRAESVDGQVVAPGRKTYYPIFGYYVGYPAGNGVLKKKCVFTCTCTSKVDSIYIYFNSIETILQPADFQEFMQRMRELFGSVIKPYSQKVTEQYVPLDAIANKIVAFEDLMRWLKKQAANPVGAATQPQ